MSPGRPSLCPVTWRKLPVRGDEPAELRYHLSIMAQPSLYVGMDFILEFYA